jgi:hypothetical protein
MVPSQQMDLPRRSAKLWSPSVLTATKLAGGQAHNSFRILKSHERQSVCLRVAFLQPTRILGIISIKFLHLLSLINYTMGIYAKNASIIPCLVCL